MSDYGVSWRTNANNMAISSEGYGLVYIGQGWSQGYVDRGLQTAPVCTAYVVSSIYPPLVFIEAPDGVVSRVISVNQVNSSAWVVIVASIQGNSLQTTTPTRYEPVIHIFARMSTAAPGEHWGLLIKDAAGNRAWDSRENMMSARALIDWPEQNTADGGEHQQSFQYPAWIQRPAHFGFGAAAGMSVLGSNPMKTQFNHLGGFNLNNGLIQRRLMVDNWWSADSGTIRLSASYQQECSIIIDVADYV